jgi:hypothetical protein
LGERVFDPELSGDPFAAGSVATYYHEASPLGRQSKGCGLSNSRGGAGYDASLASHPVFHFHVSQSCISITIDQNFVFPRGFSREWLCLLYGIRSV